jgi:hypothetical protein
MEYTFIAKGHPNVTSRHKTTFEVTKDPEIGITADCIVGVSSEASMENLPRKIREKIQTENTKIKLILETENARDIIKGYGSPELSLDHPTDMVCRKSTYTCGRTLMIRADKASMDLKKELIEDLKNRKRLIVKIIIAE